MSRTQDGFAIQCGLTSQGEIRTGGDASGHAKKRPRLPAEGGGRRSRTRRKLGRWNGRRIREERMWRDEDEWRNNSVMKRQARPLIPGKDH
jgi:hypothetical protein